MNRKEYLKKYNHDNKDNICPTTKRHFKTAFTDHDRIFINEKGEKEFLFLNSCKYCNQKYKFESVASVAKNQCTECMLKRNMTMKKFILIAHIQII